MILIDNGSTHNFVDQLVVQSLQLTVTAIEEFRVKVVNGEKLRCNERYEKLYILYCCMVLMWFWESNGWRSLARSCVIGKDDNELPMGQSNHSAGAQAVTPTNEIHIQTID